MPRTTPLTRALAAALALLAVIALPESSGALGPPVYVALGDSFAAGPGIPAPEEPWGCLKSTNGYPKHVAAAIGAVLRDATCSSARVIHMTQGQKTSQGWNPPQFNRLDSGVDLVTLQLGANEIGWGALAETCSQAVARGETCRDQYVDPATGRDRLRERIAEAAPKVGAVVRGIAERSPDATILVVAYAGIFSLGSMASCPAMLVDEEDGQYLRGVNEELNAMLADQAARNGARYVDVYWPGRGHTACDEPVSRWIEPIVASHAAAPAHPNLAGMQAVAGIVAAVSGGS